MTSEPFVETAAAPKPRRGRPPGSKNKPKGARRPGRPAGSKASSGGGSSMMDSLLDYMRAKPNAVFADARDAMAKAGHKLFPISWGRAQLLLGRVKKKGGRPARAATSPAPAAATNGAAPMKRGPGRPRKNAPVAPLTTARYRSAAISVAATDLAGVQAFVDAVNSGSRVELRYTNGAWSIATAG